MVRVFYIYIYIYIMQRLCSASAKTVQKKRLSRTKRIMKYGKRAPEHRFLSCRNVEMYLFFTFSHVFCVGDCSPNTEYKPEHLKLHEKKKNNDISFIPSVPEDIAVKANTSREILAS